MINVKSINIPKRSKLKSKYIQVKNRIRILIGWIKFGLTDHDFDYEFTLKAFKYKLTRQIRYNKLHGVTDDFEYQNKYMRITIKLIELIYEDGYDDQIYDKYGVSEEGALILNKKIEKAKKLLFRILSEKLESWWD